jgi:DNA end-binding protein Ku
MAMHSSWSGYLRLSLVSVPVAAYTSSAPGEGEVHFHQLHAECRSRIRYAKTCPIHGEVPRDEIVMGYEYAKDQYVIFEPGEIEKARAVSDKSVNVDAMIAEDTIDPLYFNGKTYYLIPDGAVGQKAYALIHRGLVDEKLCGIGQVVIASRAQLVLLRPLEDLLVLTGLDFATQVRKPDEFSPRVAHPSTSAEELKLTKTLLRSFVRKKFDLSAYKDEYTEKLREIVDAKVEGREVVAAPQQEKEPAVINIMDALKKSLATKTGGSEAGTLRKVAAARHTRAPARRKKSG